MWVLRVYAGTFPDVGFCGPEVTRVEEEAGSVLLVTLACSPHWTALIWTQHLVNGGTLLVSQRRACGVAVLLRV